MVIFAEEINYYFVLRRSEIHFYQPDLHSRVLWMLEGLTCYCQSAPMVNQPTSDTGSLCGCIQSPRLVICVKEEPVKAWSITLPSASTGSICWLSEINWVAAQLIKERPSGLYPHTHTHTSSNENYFGIKAGLAIETKLHVHWTHHILSSVHFLSSFSLDILIIQDISIKISFHLDRCVH